MNKRILVLAGLLAVFASIAIGTDRNAEAAGCSATAVGTASTVLLAANDLGVPPQGGRHVLSICNTGPFTFYVGFNTSNVVTSANGMPLQPGNCLPPSLLYTPYEFQPGQFVNVTNVDVAAIAVGGASTALTCDQ